MATSMGESFWRRFRESQQLPERDPKLLEMQLKAEDAKVKGPGE